MPLPACRLTANRKFCCGGGLISGTDWANYMVLLHLRQSDFLLNVNLVTKVIEGYAKRILLDICG